MKNTTTIFLLISMLFSNLIYSQSATKQIKDEVKKSFEEWLQKGEFETNAEYEKRLLNKEEKLNAITNDILAKLKKKKLGGETWTGYSQWTAVSLDEYDAESETFKMNFPHLRDTIVIKVPREKALAFKKAANGQYNVDRVNYFVFTNGDLIIQNDRWVLSKLDIIYTGGTTMGHYEENLKWQNIVFAGINPDFLRSSDNYSEKEAKKLADKKIKNGEILFCKYDITQQANYNPSNIKPISFNFSDLEISIPNQTASNKMATATPDLDMNSIKTKNKNPNAFAVVIGNKDYQYTKKVSFALNDAQTIKKYLVNVLGYNEGNIFYLENASKSNFETYFGTKENPQGKLYNNIKQGVSDVFIYYAGHGAPGLKDNKGYFVPIDCDPQYVEQGGYPLDLFYNNISKLNAKSITVITDACFSGAEIFNNISPIIITVSNPIAVADNCVVLSSSTGSQVSSWYNDKQHGMFTYFFLKALQDKDKSDKNKDGKLSFQEIFDYVSDKTEGVPYYARSIHGVDQTPAIQGTGVKNIFIEFK